MDTVVLKVGGSVITDRSADEATPLTDEMHRTAKEIATFDGDLVLVHGAGSYGHPQVERSDLDSGVDTDQDRMDLARIQRLQNELNVLYTEILQEHGVPAFPLQPSSFLTMENSELVDADISVIRGLLDLGMVPVLYGVPAYDSQNDSAILSGDALAPFIGDKIGADSVLHATDVDGIYETYPPGDGTDVIDELSRMQDVFGDSGKTSVTGGMENKVQHLLDYGQSGRIFNGKTAKTLEQVLDGESVGTAVVPSNGSE